MTNRPPASDAPEAAAEVRVAPAVVSKLAVAAGLEVPGIEDAEDVFLGATLGSGANEGGGAALYLRFSAAPGADLPYVRAALLSHVRERVRWLAGVELGAVEVEVVPGRVAPRPSAPRA